MPLRKLAPLALVTALGLAACQDVQPDAITAAAPPMSTAMLSQTAAPNRLTLGSLGSVLSEQASDYQRLSAGNRAINPSDYVCSSQTAINVWYSDQFYNTFLPALDTYFFLYDMYADELPMYEAWLLESPGKQQYFGYKGEYTNVMQRTERDVKGFWDINSANIKVVPMHGAVFQDLSKVAATYQLLFTNNDGSPLTDEQALEAATDVRDAVNSLAALNGGNHPWFSFNAVSIRANPSLGLPPTIVMGDGIMAGYGALGFGDVAPQAIFAHEFAHQIQFAKGYSLTADGFPRATAAEQTRYTELMADAFSAYFLTHKRGAAMNKHRVASFLEAFFQIGDCSFGNSGHHGTPNQRMAAAQFGFDVADQAQKQGHILTSSQFHALFVATYPKLIAPDAR